MWETIIWTFFAALLGFGAWGMSFNPPYIFSRACFLLAACVFLSRVSWWILVEHHFENRYWPYVILFGIYGFTSIALVYSFIWISDQEYKYQKQVPPQPFVVQSPPIGNLKERTYDLSDEILWDPYRHGWPQRHPILNKEKVWPPSTFSMPPPNAAPEEINRWGIERSNFYINKY